MKFKKLVESFGNENKMTIRVASGLNADGCDIVVTDAEGNILHKGEYSYGYNASYSKKWAELYPEKPFMKDIIDDLCARYGIDKSAIVFKAGKNVFSGSDVSDAAIVEFRNNFVESILKEAFDTTLDFPYMFFYNCNNPTFDYDFQLFARSLGARKVYGRYEGTGAGTYFYLVPSKEVYEKLKAVAKDKYTVEMHRLLPYDSEKYPKIQYIKESFEMAAGGDDFDKAILSMPEVKSWRKFDKRGDNIGVKGIEAEVDIYKNKMNAIIDCYINGKPEKIYIDIDSFYDSIINKYEYRSVDADYLGLEIGDVLDKVDEKIEDYLETKYPDTFTSKDLKKIYDQVNDDFSNDIIEWFDDRDRAIDYDFSGDLEEAFDDDDFEVSEQEFSSAETANGNAKANGGLGRVPALFTKIKYPAKGLVFDYGCGKESTVQQITNYLKSQNIDYAGYDKFNRSASENSEALKKVRAAGGADIATSANVLNVIKEKDVRVNEVIRNMYKLLKSGGVAYFDVYSDKKKEGPKQTGKDKWQEFRGIDTYVDEVAEIFGKDNVQLKGSIIIAKK